MQTRSHHLHEKRSHKIRFKMDGDRTSLKRTRGAAEFEEAEELTQTSLTALSQPTTVYRRKRPVAELGTSQGTAPWPTFPRLISREATDIPRQRRFNLYAQAADWLDEQCKAAHERLYSSLFESLISWLKTVGRDDEQHHRDPSSGERLVEPMAMAAIASTDRVDTMLCSISRQLRAASEPGLAFWAEASLADMAIRGAGQLINFFCSQWLSAMGHSTFSSSEGTAAIWSETVKTLGEKSLKGGRKPILILSLPSLPSSPLFSTLEYLLKTPISNRKDSTQIAVLLKTCDGPSGLDTLAWEEKKCLDIERFSAPDWSLQKFIADLTFHPEARTHLPSGLLRLAQNSLATSVSASSNDLGGTKEWLALALALYAAQEPTLSLRSFTKPAEHIPLQASDFTPEFFSELRLELISALQPPGRSKPKLELLASTGEYSLKRLMTDDDAFLSYLQDDKHALVCQRKENLGIELLHAVPHIDAAVGEKFREKVASFRLALALVTTTVDGSPSGASEAEQGISSLRQALQDLLTPVLRSVRRNETELGGLNFATVEGWLDSMEDLILAHRERATPEGDAMAKSRNPMNKDVEHILGQVRALQQSLNRANTSREQPRDGPSSVNPTTLSGAAQAEIVSGRLMREENLRGIRKDIVDWFSGLVRRLLIPQPRIDLVKGNQERLLRLAATVEGMINPSPRANMTLALSKPSIYLEHFSLSAHATILERQRSSKKGTADAKRPSEELACIERLNHLLAREKPSLQSIGGLHTDLSLAYALLREAGGLGAGIKGRLINVFDWYHAWCLGADVQLTKEKDLKVTGGAASREHTAETEKQDLRARFALALSQLALLGYIKRTSKGNGQAVLKVGGWDVLPGQEMLP